MKTSKTISILVLLLMAGFLPLKAQTQTKVICNGTTTNMYIPLRLGSVGYATQHSQIIYPADSLIGLTGYQITKLTFHPNRASVNFNGNQATVKLIPTIATGASLASNFLDISTTVKTSLVDPMLTNSLLELPLKHRFVYTGDNLLIDISTGFGNTISAPEAMFYGVSVTDMYSRMVYETLGVNTQISQFYPKVTIEYKIPSVLYTITATAGTGGNITFYAAEGNDKYEAGSTPIFTITPEQGYEINEVLVDEKSVDITNNTYTFPALDGDHTISATFKPITYTITWHSEHSAMNDNPLTYTVLELPITLKDLGSNSDIIFRGWFDNEKHNGDAIVRIELGTTGNLEFWANWGTPTTYTITASAGKGGTISPEGVITVKEGTNQTFTIMPNPGYSINMVLVDNVPVIIPVNNRHTFGNIRAHHTISVSFNLAVTVANEEETCPYVPIQKNSISLFMQNNKMLYPAEWLQSMSGARVNKMIFYSTKEFYNFLDPDDVPYIGEIRISETMNTLLTYATNTTNPDTLGMQLVYSGPVKIDNFRLEFILDQPFIYEGTNLLISIFGVVAKSSFPTYEGSFYGVSTLNTMSSWASSPIWSKGTICFLPKLTFEYDLPATYSIISSTLDPNGAILPTGIRRYVEGQSAEYQIIAAPGYEIDQVIIDGKYDETVTESIKATGYYTFENISDDSEIAVSFKPTVYFINYYNVHGADNPNPPVYTVETPTINLLPLSDIIDSTFAGWYATPVYTGTTVNRISEGSVGDRNLYAKWDYTGLTPGITEGKLRDVHVYAYRNTVYIVNKFQIPLKSVEITDITGRMVYRSISVQSPISLNLAEGQYIVRLISNDNVLNTKISIVN